MTPQEILDDVANNFDKGQRRKFLPALLITFISTLRELDATGGKFNNLQAFYKHHPRRTTSAGGKSANTLIVWRDATKTGPKDKSLSIRPAYETIADWFRSDQKRFDFPSAAPHATQAWGDYEHWLDALLGYSDAQLDALEKDVKAFVLAKLPAHVVDSTLIKREPPRFYLFLRDFDLSAKTREVTGAAYQGAVFGYLRADAAHLQVDVAKVRTGSKRVGRIGDIDAREGELLVISAEVKQYVLPLSDLAGFAEFAALVAGQQALGLVVALNFDEGVREALVAMGLEPVSKQDLIDRVRIWDPLKQRTAVQALLYYVHYKEQNSALYARLREFLKAIEAPIAIAAPSIPPDPS